MPRQRQRLPPLSLPGSIRKSNALWKGSVGTTTWGLEGPALRPHVSFVLALYAGVGGVLCTKLLKTLGSNVGLEELLLDSVAIGGQVPQ